MQFDREKLKQAVLYICNRCPADKLGAVKLHKVLYFSDMVRYADTGRPVTGATYRKRPHGPTCDSLPRAISELQNDSKLEVRDVEYFGYFKKEFRALSEPDIRVFTDDEVRLLEDVIEFVCVKNTAKTISDFSHARPWELVDFGEEIGYNSSFLLYPEEVSQEARDWADNQVTEIAAERSSKNPLDFTDIADFRSRVLEASGG